MAHEGPGLSRPRPEPVAVGVEEEFHTVDLRTRRLTARADRLIQRLPADSFGSELQRSVLEANSRPWVRLADLAEDITALRRAAIAAAEPLGLGIVAAGTVPLADPDALKITSDPRHDLLRCPALHPSAHHRAAHLRRLPALG